MAPYADDGLNPFDSRQMRTPASFTAGGRTLLPPGVNPIVFLPPTIADWLSSFLMGVLLMQVLSYQRKYGRTDPRWTKYWVYALFGLNIITFALAFSKSIKIRALHLCDFTYFINFHNRPDDLFLYSVVPLVIGGSQVFMIVRSFLFARALQDGSSSSPRRGCGVPRWTLAWFGIKIFLCFAATTFGLMGTIITAVGYDNYGQLGAINKSRWIGKKLITTNYFLYLLTSTILDVTIAATLSWDLHRAKTGQSASTSVLGCFITVTLSNGIFLAMAQALALILYFVGEVGWSDCSAVLVPRLATVTLLTSILRPREAYRTLQKQQLEKEAEERREMAAILGGGGGGEWTGGEGGGTGVGGTTMGSGTTMCGSCCTKRGMGPGSPTLGKEGTMGGLGEMGELRGFEVGVGVGARRKSEVV